MIVSIFADLASRIGSTLSITGHNLQYFIEFARNLFFVFLSSGPDTYVRPPLEVPRASLAGLRPSQSGLRASQAGLRGSEAWLAGSKACLAGS